MTKDEVSPKEEDMEDQVMDAAEEAEEAEEEESEESQESEKKDGATLSKAERLARMKKLRKKMTDSLHANRRAVVTESTQSHTSAAQLRHLAKLKRKAELLDEKATHTSDSLERKKNWEWSIEDNERWEKKKKRKESRGQFEFTDYDDVARRNYKKEIDKLKVDKKGYEEMKRAAEGEGGDEMVESAEGSGGAMVSRKEGLYRDRTTFAYGDHKPSEDAIDRVVGHMNDVLDRRTKHSRVRKEEGGDITYINEMNKAFNKKLDRYFNKYTKEIKDNFERGTAL